MIHDSAGLHMTPAGNICKEAIKYQSSVHMRTANMEANAKSLISLLSACVKCGNEIEIVCDGADEEEALRSIIQIIEKDNERKAE